MSHINWFILDELREMQKRKKALQSQLFEQLYDQNRGKAIRGPPAFFHGQQNGCGGPNSPVFVEAVIRFWKKKEGEKREAGEVGRGVPSLISALAGGRAIDTG